MLNNYLLLGLLNIYIKTAIVVLCASLIVFLRQLPDYWAAIHTPTGYEYSGQASWFDPWDVNVYVGAIRYGQSGHILLVNQYRTDNTKEAFLYPLYTLTGYFVRTINPYILFHALGAGVGMGFCLILYVLAYLVFRKFWYSLCAMILTSSGGGFGWMFKDGFKSADTFVTSFTMMSGFQRAHEGIGTILYICSLMFYFFATQTPFSSRRFQYLAISTASLIALILFYPYYLLIYALVAGAFTFIYVREREKKKPLFIWVSISLGFSAILSLFYLIHLRMTSLASATTENLHNLTSGTLVLGYGPLILFFLIQIYLRKRNYTSALPRFLWLWVGISFFSAYLPFGFSRFYFRGLYFPLVLLALAYTLQLRYAAQRKLLILFLCMFLPLTSLYIFSKRMNEAGKINQWFYYSREIGDAFRYIRSDSKNGVLSGYILGNYIPPKTNKSVYFGHNIQSTNGKIRQAQLRNFYSGKLSTSEAKIFLGKNNISLIVYGPEERTFGGHVYPFMRKTYSNSRVQIYTVL
ncbi:MAG: hypothetical protein NUV65_06640 [Candidatus Roizmanbacteria bacterium]|nr:hypothetical protein [Candidatus Roizmanbacteria bacterium]